LIFSKIPFGEKIGMAFVLTYGPHQKPIAAKTTMKEKNNRSIITICILLFHLGLLYWAFEQLAPAQPKQTVEQEIQVDTP